MTPDPLPAILDQLAAHTERIIQLDAREAGHFATLTGQLTELAGLATEHTDEADGYQPDPAPPWWRLAPADRAEPLARLRAWVGGSPNPAFRVRGRQAGTCRKRQNPTTCHSPTTGRQAAPTM